MIVLQRLWVADGCGPMAAMKVSSFFFFSWFFLGPMAVVHLFLHGSNGCCSSFSLALDLVYGFWVLIWLGWVLI